MIVRQTLKLVAFATLALTLSSQAVANDGGIAFVDVKGINPGSLKENAPVEIYGVDAEKFMRLLPATTSAMTAMMTPEQVELYHNNTRGLAFVSNGWNLFLHCTGIQEMNVGRSDVAFTKSPTKCTISVSKVADPQYKYDMLGDSFPLNAADPKQRTCK